MSVYPGQGHQIPDRGNLYEYSVFKEKFDPFRERLSILDENAEDILNKYRKLQGARNVQKSGETGGGGGSSGRIPPAYGSGWIGSGGGVRVVFVHFIEIVTWRFIGSIGGTHNGGCPSYWPFCPPRI